MAYGKKTGGRDIQPGQVLNPNGRPRLPEDLREARKHTKREVETVLHKLFWLKPDELREVISDPGTPAIEIAIARCLAAAIKHGDYKRISFLLDRTLGPMPKKVDIDPDEGDSGGGVIYLPKNGREEGT